MCILGIRTDQDCPLCCACLRPQGVNGNHANTRLSRPCRACESRRLLASSRLVMSAWPWKAARDSSPTLSLRSMSACVSRASAPVKSSPSSSKRSPASDFLHVQRLSAHAHVQD